MRLLATHDWLVDADGQARDLAVGRRLEAVAALGTIERPDAEAGVVRALDDDDPRVRRAAVAALGAEVSPKAAKALARAAATWRDPSLGQARAAALDLLERLNDECSPSSLPRRSMDDPQFERLQDSEEAELRRLFAAPPGRATEVLAERLALRLSATDHARAPSRTSGARDPSQCRC